MVIHDQEKVGFLNGGFVPVRTSQPPAFLLYLWRLPNPRERLDHPLFKPYILSVDSFQLHTRYQPLHVEGERIQFPYAPPSLKVNTT